MSWVRGCTSRAVFLVNYKKLHIQSTVQIQTYDWVKGIASRAIFLVKYKKLQIQSVVQSIGCWCRKEEAQLNDPANKEEEG